MNGRHIEFRKTAIQPVACLKEGWNVVRDQYGLFLGITFVGMIIGSAVPFGILMGPMMCGIFLAYLKKMRGEPVAFDTLFKGFDYFVQSFILVLVLMAVSMVVTTLLSVMILVGFLVAENGESVALGVAIVIVFTVATTLFLALLSALFLFAFELIVDKNLTAPEAAATSARAVLANLWGVLGLVVLTLLLTIAGMLCCYVGAFLVAPVTFGATVVAYKKVFPDLDAPPPLAP